MWSKISAKVRITRVLRAKILCDTRVLQWRIKVQLLLHMYALSDMYALLLLAGTAERSIVFTRLRQCAHPTNTSQPSKRHLDRFSRFCTAHPLGSVCTPSNTWFVGNLGPQECAPNGISVSSAVFRQSTPGRRARMVQLCSPGAPMCTRS